MLGLPNKATGNNSFYARYFTAFNTTSAVTKRRDSKEIVH